METKDWFMLIGGIAVVLLSIAAVIFSVKSKKHIDKALSAGLAEIKEMNARVKKLSCKEVDGCKKNSVVFENEAGEEIEISVTEEIYSEFKEGEAGLLTLADGELLSFVIDEEI